MSDTTPCPSNDRLRCLLQGEVLAAELDDIASHVETCARCIETLRAIPIEQDGLRELREAFARQSPPSREEVRTFVVALYQRLFDTEGQSTASAFHAVTLDSAAVDDRYEVLGELGRGGMGVVFKARQRSTQRLVALKMIVSGDWAQEDERARFLDEIELAARLRHVNIVQVYEAGEFNGRPFYSMEFVEGETLASRLRAGSVPPLAAAALVERLARAVQVAHEQRILHRDLKPANVLLDRSTGAEGVALGEGVPRFEPKVADFGLAKRLDAPGRTRTDAVMGTPRYMAPEQARGDTASMGPGTDIHAIGAILYEMLTGRPPFGGATSLETIDQVLYQEPIPPRRLRPSVPRDLETICLRCLQKEPGQRFASAAILADRLRLVLDGKPIPDRPIGVMERTWRWCRRKPVTAALVATLCVLVMVTLLGLGAVTWLWQASERARQSAEANADDVWLRLYGADMKVVSDFARVGDLESMRPILNRYREPGLRKDPREFTWRYLQRMVDEPKRIDLPDHANGYGCGAFSRDGARIAFGSKNGQVRVFHLVDGKVDAGTTTAWNAHTGPLHQIIWLPDGSLLTTGDDLTIRWWDASGKQLRCLEPSPAAQPMILAPNGRLAAYHDRSRSLRAEHHGLTIVELPGGEVRSRLEVADSVKNVTLSPSGRFFSTWGGPQVLLRDVLTGDRRDFDTWELDHNVNDLAFNANGTHFAVGLSNGSIHILDARLFPVPDSMAPRAHIPPLLAPIQCLAFSADGEALFSAGDDLMIHRWDLTNGPHRLIGSTRERQRKLITDPYGRWLVSISESGKAVLWDVRSKVSGSIDVPLQPAGPFAFAQDHRVLAVACRGHAIHVLNSESDHRICRLQGHTAAILDLAMSPNGCFVASSSADLTWRWWDARTGRMLREFPLETPLCRLKISRDGRILAVGRSDGRIELWRLGNSQDLTDSPWRTIVHGASLHSFALCPEGTTLWSWSTDGHFRTWDIESGAMRGMPITIPSLSPLGDVVGAGQLLVTCVEPHRSQVRFQALDSLDGKTVLRGRVRELEDSHAHINALAISPRGDLIATAQGRSINVFSTRDGLRVIGILDHLDFGILGLGFSPDGERLAAVTRDHILTIWNTKTWAVIQPGGQPLGPTQGLAFDGKGKLLITATSTPGGHIERRYSAFGKNLAMTRQDNMASDTLRAWDVATGRESPRPKGDPRHRGVMSLALADNQAVVLGASLGGKLLRWSLPDRKPLPPYFISANAQSVDRTAEATKNMFAVSREWTENIRSVAANPKYGWIALLDDTGNVVLLDPRTGERLLELPKGTFEPHSAVAFTPDGAMLIVARGNELEGWPLQSKRDHTEIIPGSPCYWRTLHKRPILCIAISADGNTMATGASDNVVCLWNKRTDESRTLLGHTADVTSVAFSTVHQTLASSSRDGTIRLWHPVTAQPLAILHGHEGHALGLQFSPDGKILASVGTNNRGGGQLFVWKAAP